MKNMIKKLSTLFIASTVVASATLVSCSDETVDRLDNTNYPSVISELYAGLWGVASTVADVADQAYILESLRSNMIEPTESASQELFAIYNYNVQDLTGNSVANPANYYRVIMSVNDYVKHIDDFRKANPTALAFESKYNVSYELYISTAIRYKVWAYMMLAKIYGEAVYFDDPLTEVQDLSQYPLLPFDEVINKCVELMTGAGMYGVNGCAYILPWKTFIFPSLTSDSESIQQFDRYQFTPSTLLAELYLWQGKYKDAYNMVVDEIANSAWTSDKSCYIVNLRGTYSNYWKSCARQFNRYNHVTIASYVPRQFETNRLDDYASDEAPNHYLIRPTQWAMAKFDTTSVPNDLTYYYDRYRGAGATYKETSRGNMVLNKWLNPLTDPTTQESIISLYRDGNLWLMLCEALTGVAREYSESDSLMCAKLLEAALVSMNGGAGNTAYCNANGTYITGQGVCFDTLTYNTGLNAYPTNLYQEGNQQRQNRGLRGRVNMSSVGDDIFGKDEDGNPLYTDLDVQLWKLDSLITEEYFFELSAEGHTLYCTKRMRDRYKDDPERVQFFNKWIAGSRGADVAAKLENDENWFIKYKLD